MAKIKLAEYTFNNSVGDCLPTLTPNTITMTKEDSISGTTTRRIVYIDDSVLPTEISFKGQTSLLTVDYLRIDSNIITMKQMFYNCSRLTSLDVSNFNTGNVTDMSYMFSQCSSLTSLDLSSFNTGNVTDMSYMFYQCSSLTSLDLSNFNTQNVTTMDGMFYNCPSLTSLDLSNFNTQNVTTMYQMFERSSKLTSLDLSNFNTGKVTDMSSMFYQCSSLTSLDLSNFNTGNVRTMSNILTNTPLLTNIGAVYCNSSTINKISNLVTTNTTIWYTDAKLEDLTVKNNITYKEYKSNILTVNEDVTLRSNGDVYDELNLLTGRLTQRIDENNEVLAQAVVKTVDLTIVDQDGKTINKLNSFNGTTHVSTEVAENSPYPMVSLGVASELQASVKID